MLNITPLTVKFSFTREINICHVSDYIWQFTPNLQQSTGHVNSKIFDNKTPTYLQQNQTLLVILVNRIASPSNLFKSQIQIFVKLISYLWQSNLLKLQTRSITVMLNIIPLIVNKYHQVSITPLTKICSSRKSITVILNIIPLTVIFSIFSVKMRPLVRS